MKPPYTSAKGIPKLRNPRLSTFRSGFRAGLPEAHGYLKVKSEVG